MGGFLPPSIALVTTESRLSGFLSKWGTRGAAQFRLKRSRQHFQEQVGDDIVTTFETIEQMTNTAQLIGRVTVSEVPIPAAIPLFLSGIAGLGFAGRMRKKKAA